MRNHLLQILKVMVDRQMMAFAYEVANHKIRLCIREPACLSVYLHTTNCKFYLIFCNFVQTCLQILTLVLEKCRHHLVVDT